jgi:hypothetical protein
LRDEFDLPRINIARSGSPGCSCQRLRNAAATKAGPGLIRLNAVPAGLRHIGIMNEQVSYLNVAKILRQQAQLPGMPPEKRMRAMKLAEYFEMLAANPHADIPQEQCA